MLDVSVQELGESFQKHYEVYKNGLGSDNSKRLALFYAVECGLKGILLKKYHVFLYSKLDEKYQYGHDIKKILKNFGIESSYKLNSFQTKHKDQVHVEHYHEVWRYGMELDQRNEEIVKEIEANLSDIAKWIDENRMKRW